MTPAGIWPLREKRGAEYVHALPMCLWGGGVHAHKRVCPGTVQCPLQSHHLPSYLSGPLPPRPAARLPCAPWSLDRKAKPGSTGTRGAGLETPRRRRVHRKGTEARAGVAARAGAWAPGGEMAPSSRGRGPRRSTPETRLASQSLPPERMLCDSRFRPDAVPQGNDA